MRAVCAVALVVVAACSGGDDEPRSASSQADDQELDVAVVSSRPEFISGGDALLAVTPGPDADPDEAVSVDADGDDVLATMVRDPDDPDRLLLHVEGLPDGEAGLTVTMGDLSTELDVENHPTSGPMFSGEHLELAACSTESFGLAPSTPEDDCAAPTEVSWTYVDAAGEQRDLPDPAAVPADAEMVTIDGRTVPFVIRTETGVLNRAVYRISVLEPEPDLADPLATIDTSAWNGRLVYSFGGGCGAGFTQGFSWSSPPLEELRRGYAAATATFNTFQVLCNDVISAETVSMVKEHFVEAYGEPVHTIGEGGSGGAIQQLLIAQNYPGLLDAIAPTLPFPDALSIGGGVFDCALLSNYYESPEGSTLTEDQRAAINGHAVGSTCDMWDATFANNINPSGGCRFNVGAVFAGDSAAPLPGIPEDEIYDPLTNPTGWRCTVWETNVAVTGRDPDTGFARSGYDNEGIQYGLDALNAGTITVDQFLDLNEKVGGFDIDGQPQADRSVVAHELVARAYETGRITGPYGGIPDTPIILMNLYTDDLGDIHDRVRAFSFHDRLASDEDGPWPDNVSLWTIPVELGGDLVARLSGAVGSDVVELTLLLDEWLTAAEDRHDGPRQGEDWQEALAAAKPQEAESRCGADSEAPLTGADANEDEACSDTFPIHEEPRMAAGAPRSGDVLKCQLVAVEDATELYDAELSDDELDRLAEIFPDGVCDYSKPSVGQSEPTGTWQDFDDLESLG